MATAVLATTSPNSLTGILTSAWGKLVSARQLSLDIFTAVEHMRTVLPPIVRAFIPELLQNNRPVLVRGQKLFSFQLILE
jgi:hypothetical protein